MFLNVVFAYSAVKAITCEEKLGNFCCISGISMHCFLIEHTGICRLGFL